jgi:hypothetical protein
MERDYRERFRDPAEPSISEYEAQHQRRPQQS